MGTVAEKLAYLWQTKNQIREAIEAKGVSLPEETPFREYPQMIGQIEAGAQLPDKVFYFDDMNGNKYVADGYEVAYFKYDNANKAASFGTLDTDNAVWGTAAVASTHVGDYGYAVRFQNNSASLVLDNGFASGCPGFTLGGWFYRPSVASHNEWLLFATGGSNSHYWGPFLWGEALACYVIGTATYSICDIPVKTWNHFALSILYDEEAGSVTLKVYLNASLVHTASVISNCDFTQVTIGNVTSATVWEGYMKNTFASWGALSLTEIRQMMLRD